LNSMLGIWGMFMLINAIVSGSPGATKAAQARAFTQIDHQVQQIDHALAPALPPTLINRPRTATRWTAAVFASAYQTAWTHPRTAFLPRTLRVNHQSVRLLGGWLTNGTPKWRGASGLMGNFTHGVTPFALALAWPTLPRTASSYAFVQPISASQAQALWHHTSQPHATFPGFISYIPHLRHHPAYLVLWVSRPHSSPASDAVPFGSSPHSVSKVGCPPSLAYSHACKLVHDHASHVALAP